MSKKTMLGYLLWEAKQRNDMRLSNKTYSTMLKGSRERHNSVDPEPKEEKPKPMTEAEKKFELKRLKKIIDDNYSFVHVMRIKL